MSQAVTVTGSVCVCHRQCHRQCLWQFCGAALAATRSLRASIQLPLVGSIKFILSYLVLVGIVLTPANLLINLLVSFTYLGINCFRCWGMESMEPEMFSVNVPIPDTIGLARGEVVC